MATATSTAPTAVNTPMHITIVEPMACWSMSPMPTALW